MYKITDLHQNTLLPCYSVVAYSDPVFLFLSVDITWELREVMRSLGLESQISFCLRLTWELVFVK